MTEAYYVCTAVVLHNCPTDSAKVLGNYVTALWSTY